MKKTQDFSALGETHGPQSFPKFSPKPGCFELQGSSHILGLNISLR